MITKHTSIKVVTALILIFSFQLTLAAIPATLNYQAYLTDDMGVPIDGTADVEISIYNVDVGGFALWSETRVGTTVNKGVLSVELGDTVPFPPGLFEMPLWIGVKVGTDAEMAPRRPITSTGFAFKASDADTIEGISAASLDQSAHVADMANPHNVTTAQIGAISGADLTAHAGDSSAHHVKTSSFTELSGQISDGQIPALIARDAEIVPTILANDGPGSTLNADLLDGLSSSAFMSSGADLWVNTSGDTMTGKLTLNPGLLEAMTIDSALSSSWLRWEENGSTRGLIGFTSGNTFWVDERVDAFGIKANYVLHLGDDTLTMTINDGNVGIGTTRPLHYLDVQGEDANEWLSKFSQDTSDGGAYALIVEADAYGSGSGGATGGWFDATGGSAGGAPTAILAKTHAYGTANAYAVRADATIGSTTGREYAFYGDGEAYISQDLEVDGTLYIGFQRIIGNAASLSSLTTCNLINSGNCYYGNTSLTCPTGKVVVGGGCTCNSAYNCSLIKSYPNTPTSWSCAAVASSSLYAVTPHVTCARVAN